MHTSIKVGRTRWRIPGLALSLALASLPAAAFPPYHTTDADTAGAGMLELRLGLLKLQRRESMSERSAPLSRVNFGIGGHYEVISELEYAPDEHRFADGAVGFKWASLTNGRGIGVETLVLLPVHSDLSGAGVESQFLTTLQHERWQLHVNAGGFYDPRSAATERGWRASVLAEFPRKRFRPGVELFVKDARSSAARAQAGLGVIADLERIQIRTALHVGLNGAAPDLEASIWFSWKWRIDRTGP
ncbi:MAG TPA: hypothetical protein VJA26_13260 [Gammaproteobacteria bacterium]|nr:hypothetical protein [Gammaproteobacteria bacterium]